MNINLLSEKVGRITSIEQLIEASGMSLDDREIIKAKVNKREVAMKQNDGKAELTELFQVVAELRLKHELLGTDTKQMLFDLFDSHIPVLPTKTCSDGPLLAQIIHADLHIDRIEHAKKNYLKEIDDRTMRLFERLLKHNPDKLVYANIGDYFNSDTNSRTTKGTEQQNYLPERESFRLGLEHQLSLIKTLSQEVATEVVYIPGNHDRTKLQALSDAVDLYFTKTLDVDSTSLERKYKVRGHNGIMYTHGDGIKNKQIPLTRQTEHKLHKFNHVFKGHGHTPFSDKAGNIYIRQVGSPARPSARENNLGHNGRSYIEGHIFDKLKGKIADMYA